MIIVLHVSAAQGRFSYVTISLSGNVPFRDTVKNNRLRLRRGSMAKYLVIVESPAKVKTIKKFLGANYDVEASNGHVRDFPKSQFGIDVEHDFEPKYITIRGKGELLAKLRKAAKKADKNLILQLTLTARERPISWSI